MTALLLADKNTSADPAIKDPKLVELQALLDLESADLTPSVKAKLLGEAEYEEMAVAKRFELAIQEAAGGKSKREDPDHEPKPAIKDAKLAELQALLDLDSADLTPSVKAKLLGEAEYEEMAVAKRFELAIQEAAGGKSKREDPDHEIMFNLEDANEQFGSYTPQETSSNWMMLGVAGMVMGVAFIGLRRSQKQDSFSNWLPSSHLLDRNEGDYRQL